MKSKIKKGTALAITGIFALVLITGCSTTNESGSKLQGLISRFVSSVRPIQGNPDSHYLLACYHQVRGEHKKALEELNIVLLIDPENVKALNGMGLSYDKLKDYSHAQAAYRKALQLNPDLDYVQNNLGYSYLLQGRIDEAIPVLQKAIALNPKKAGFHNNLGLAFASKDRMDIALDEFKLAGNESQANFNIAQIYYRQGKFRAAKDHYSEALKLDPSFDRAKLASRTTDTLARLFQTTDTHLSSAMEKHSLKKPSNLIIQVVDNGNSLSVENAPVSDKSTGIEVSNGNGVNGAARQLSDYLHDRGLTVSYITNADHFNHRATTIYYQKGYREAAFRLAGQIPGSQNIKQETSFDRPQTNVKIIIGKDIPSIKKLSKI